MRIAFVFGCLLLTACGYSSSALRAPPPTPPSVTGALTQVQSDIQQFSTDTQALMAAIAAQQPPAPPPPPPAPSESPDGTVITPGAGSITDASGAAWTLDNNTNIRRNGAALPGQFSGWQSHQLVYKTHAVNVLGLDGNWYKWNGSAFVAASNPLQTSYYVAPGGSDAALGDIDSPFASLGRCQDAMRTGPIQVCSVRSSGTGFYDFSACQINLTPADDGELWQAFTGDPANSVVLDGGKNTSTPFVAQGAVKGITIQGFKLQNFTGSADF